MIMEYKKIFQVVKVPEITHVRNSDFIDFDHETTYHKNLELVFDDLSRLMGISGKRSKYWYPEGKEIILVSSGKVSSAEPGDYIVFDAMGEFEILSPKEFKKFFTPNDGNE